MMRFLVIFLACCLAQAAGAQQDPLPTVELGIGMHLVRAEVADSMTTRMTGLMQRASLPQNGGMVFVTTGPAVESPAVEGPAVEGPAGSARSAVMRPTQAFPGTDVNITSDRHDRLRWAPGTSEPSVPAAAGRPAPRTARRTP